MRSQSIQQRSRNTPTSAKPRVATIPREAGGENERLPIQNVSWRQAKAYLEWLSDQTEGLYRLPSEAEWEYACRAGTTTAYSFGRSIEPDQVRCMFVGVAGTNYGRCIVGTKPPNAWGIHEMHGSGKEWVEDIWHENYYGAPADGSAWTDAQDDYCERPRVVRSGGAYPDQCRSAYRDRIKPGYVGPGPWYGTGPGLRPVRSLD